MDLKEVFETTKAQLSILLPDQFITTMEPGWNPIQDCGENWFRVNVTQPHDVCRIKPIADPSREFYVGAKIFASLRLNINIGKDLYMVWTDSQGNDRGTYYSSLEKLSDGIQKRLVKICQEVEDITNGGMSCTRYVGWYLTKEEVNTLFYRFGLTA